jgi:hypothetical protein
MVVEKRRSSKSWSDTEKSPFSITAEPVARRG